MFQKLKNWVSSLGNTDPLSGGRPLPFDRRFVIVTAARTGSNALVNALTNHADIHCDYEVFHPMHIYTAGDSPFDLSERDADPVRFVRTVMEWNAGRYPEQPIYGFKLFFGHSDAVYQRLIEDQSWQKIVLRRDNILDQYVSEDIARQSAKWNSMQGEHKRTSVTVDLEHFDKYRARMDANYTDAVQTLERTGQQFLSLEYADVAEGRFNKVCDFLGVDGSSVATELKKQNSPRSASKIENADQVQAWLKDNGLSHWWVD